MARKDEPSNPFKKSGRIESSPKNRRSVPSRRKSTPPAPPSRSPSPAIPPGGKSSDSGKSKVSPDANIRGPAKAGRSVGLRKQEKTRKQENKKIDIPKNQVSDGRTSPAIVAPTEVTSSSPKAKTNEPQNPFTKKKAPRTNTRPNSRHGKRNRPQAPSKRIRKLHRGKYMEFKYDVRRILDEENVEDEHRSNVLGQTWAKGERQGVNEAKDFLSEKISSNIISQKCADRIIKLIDTLTTRR